MVRSLVVLMLVAACGKGGSGQSATAAELDPYWEGLAHLRARETAALGDVAAHSGAAYTNDDQLLAGIDAAIPGYREYVAGLKELVPPDDLKAMHARLVDLSTAELAHLEKLGDAIHRGDGTAVLMANQEQQRIAREMDALAADFQRAKAQAKLAKSTP